MRREGYKGLDDQEPLLTPLNGILYRAVRLGGGGGGGPPSPRTRFEEPRNGSETASALRREYEQRVLQHAGPGALISRLLALHLRTVDRALLAHSHPHGARGR
jgi:hypothetical protein